MIIKNMSVYIRGHSYITSHATGGRGKQMYDAVWWRGGGWGVGSEQYDVICEWIYAKII